MDSACLFGGGGQSILAGRIAGAFRNAGNDRIADDIVKTMSAAGYTVEVRGHEMRRQIDRCSSCHKTERFVWCVIIQ